MSAIVENLWARLGNCLHVWAHAKKRAENEGHELRTAPWVGERIFTLDGHPCGRPDGREDFDFGIRLERSGVKICYNRNMLTLESEEGHHGEPSLPRERRLVLKDRLPADYDSSPKPNEAEAYFSDHVLLNRVRNETTRVLPLFPEGLRAMRQEFLATGMVPIPAGPSEDWRDGTPLKDL